MADLSVDLMGIRLKNPFLLASVPSSTAANMPEAAKAGWAGGVLWGIDAWPEWGKGKGEQPFNRGYVPREFQSAESGYLKKGGKQWWAYQNNLCVPAFNKGGFQIVERAEAICSEAKKSGLVIGHNITESDDPEPWVKIAGAAERGGADFLELNWSCPYLPEIGMTVGRDIDVQLTLMRELRRRTDLPVMVKFNAMLETDVLERMAKQAVSEGANGISISNTLPGFVGIDIETGIPLATELGMDGKIHGVSGGISGPAIKPVALRGVADVHRAVDVPLCGIGGIADWKSAVEFMLLGARAVQVGTAVMLFGYQIVEDMIRGLEEYMERKGYRNILDFVGSTADRFMVSAPYGGSAFKQPKYLEVDEEQCTGCGFCVTACTSSSSGSGACTMKNGVAHIDPDLCHVCYSCRIVCPTRAIVEKWVEGYPL